MATFLVKFSVTCSSPQGFSIEAGRSHLVTGPFRLSPWSFGRRQVRSAQSGQPTLAAQRGLPTSPVSSLEGRPQNRVATKSGDRPLRARTAAAGWPYIVSSVYWTPASGAAAAAASGAAAAAAASGAAAAAAASGAAAAAVASGAASGAASRRAAKLQSMWTASQVDVVTARVQRELLRQLGKLESTAGYTATLRRRGAASPYGVSHTGAYGGCAC